MDRDKAYGSLVERAVKKALDQHLAEHHQRCPNCLNDDDPPTRLSGTMEQPPTDEIMVGCEHCAYSVSAGFPTRYRCKRFPPPEGQEAGPGDRLSRFPLVHCQEWCGEFDPRKAFPLRFSKLPSKPEQPECDHPCHEPNWSPGSRWKWKVCPIGCGRPLAGKEEGR